MTTQGPPDPAPAAASAGLVQAGRLLSEEELDGLQRLHMRAAAPPWKMCGAENCTCGLVWGTPSDDTVARVYKNTPDGEWAEPVYRANFALIPALRNAFPAMFAEIRAARATPLPEKPSEARAASAGEGALRLALERARQATVAACDNCHTPAGGVCVCGTQAASAREIINAALAPAQRETEKEQK